MFLFLLNLFDGADPNRTKPVNFCQCPGQEHQYFSLKKFEIFHPKDTRGIPLVIRAIAELNHKVEDPKLEIQLVKGRIPYFRKIDDLCQPGILICPASFSQLVYGIQITISPIIPVGDYTLRLIFREKDKKLSCYESQMPIVDLDLERYQLEARIKIERELWEQYRREQAEKKG